MTIDLAVALPILVQVATLLAALAAAYVALRKWVAKIAATSQTAAQQLTTSDGQTVAGHVETTAAELRKITDHLDELSAETAETRETARSALTLANSAHERLDRHLITGHPTPPGSDPISDFTIGAT